MTIPLLLLMLLSTPAIADDSLTLHMGAAPLAYNIAAKKYFGEFARLNRI